MEKGNVIFDQCGVTVYLEGNIFIDSDGDLQFGIVVMNESDTKIKVQLDDACVNGWNVETFYYKFSEIPAQSKRNSFFALRISFVSIDTIEAVHSVEFKPYIVNAESNVRIVEAPEPVMLILPSDDGSLLY